MLTTLRIKNLALVEDLSLELLPGFNVITGETGAGKSILIGALNLILGERADRTLIRSGADACSVEAVFDVSGFRVALDGLLEGNGLEPSNGGELVLKRTFSNAGANRQFVNGSPTSLNVLAAVGEVLVDIHGPHEHQSLLHPARQLAILDAFGKLEPERQAFADLLRHLAALLEQKRQLVVDKRTYAQQLDLLRFQAEEIAAARLKPEEEEQVGLEHQRVANAARLLQLSQTALDLLSENENSVISQAGSVGRALQELQRIDSAAMSLMTLHEQSVALLLELQGALSRYIDRTEVNPERLQELEERLNLIHSLKRKYGPDIAAVIRYGEEAAQRLQSLEGRDAELARLNAELEKVEADLWRAGKVLSAKRHKLVPEIGRAVSRQLADLGFRQSRFDVTIRTVAQPGTTGVNQQDSDASSAAAPSAGWTAQGLDTVDFQFAPNPGEPARPLRSIASSGELARVMLALKTVLAGVDQIPVLVFDEVDANIGGETGHAVAEKMKQIAKARQVLCITHLAQVAAPASSHFVAAKQVRAGRTVSEIRLLGREERVAELARMLGGKTEAARRHAQTLLPP